uniref:Uncharacterized protein n=1 Tax=Romanomermis culicivorax TaxID=13658 RepID=A0A915K6F7_ROMCU
MYAAFGTEAAGGHNNCLADSLRIQNDLPQTVGVFEARNGAATVVVCRSAGGGWGLQWINIDEGFGRVGSGDGLIIATLGGGAWPRLMITSTECKATKAHKVSTSSILVTNA